MKQHESPKKSGYIHESEFKPKGFWALVVTQFQGAFNDNVHQYLIVFFLLHIYATQPQAGILHMPFGLDPLEPGQWVQNVATLVLACPFILFPGFFGTLADRYSKQRVAVATKYIEIVIMAIAGVAFWTQNALFIFFIFFLMATQSTMFGPTKYGLLPEILPETKLSWANGIMQMGTIVAVIAGTLVGGQVLDFFIANDLPMYQTAYVLMAFSAIGIFASHFITRPVAANPGQPLRLNPWAGMGRYFGAIWSDRILFNVILGYIYFWFAGALMRNALIGFAHEELALSAGPTTILMGMTGVGIALGAVAAGYMSRSRIELGARAVGLGGVEYVHLAGCGACGHLSAFPVWSNGRDAGCAGLEGGGGWACHVDRRRLGIRKRPDLCTLHVVAHLFITCHGILGGCV
jgi:acyl-[acyl-carrier-protein]-phospholipid O-acyltransferase/long-chain-fatty-acid--[acyl-carrier-protein] ligase